MEKPTSNRPEDAIYTPQQVAYYGVEQIRHLQAGTSRGMNYPIKGMADYVAPLLPGQVMAILAQTSQYKSGFMDFAEHYLALQLQEQGRDNECIIHVSVEESVEEMAWRGFARYSGEDPNHLSRGMVTDWDKLIAASITIANIPIYRIADCLSRPDSVENLYLSNIQKAIRALTSGVVLGRSIQPAAIFIDYLQALPIDPEVRRADIMEQRRLQVRNDTYRIRDMAVQFNTPVVVAVQAKQVLQGQNGKAQMPGIYDGEETSAIAQRVDRMIGMWLPKQTLPLGSSLNYAGVEFTVQENRLFQKVLKQRGKLPSGKIFPLLIDYQTGHIALDETFGKRASDRVVTTFFGDNS